MTFLGIDWLYRQDPNEGLNTFENYRYFLVRYKSNQSSHELLQCQSHRNVATSRKPNPLAASKLLWDKSLVYLIQLKCSCFNFTWPNPITAGHFSPNLYRSICKTKRITRNNAGRLNWIDNVRSSFSVK